jgi:DNA-binding NtrC family response regulator
LKLSTYVLLKLILADEEISKIHEILFVILDEIRSVKKIQIPEPVDGTIVDGTVKESWPSLADVEKAYVMQLLRHTRGSKQASARILNVDRKTLDRTIKRHNLNLSGILLHSGIMLFGPGTVPAMVTKGRVFQSVNTPYRLFRVWPIN